MRRAAELLACLCAGLGAGYAVARMTDSEPSAEIRLVPSTKHARAGQRLGVRLEVPENLSYDPAFRLMRREGNRWVAEYDLVAVSPAHPRPSFARPRGSKATAISGALSGNVSETLQLPPDIAPGRYRLKKWFLITDEQAGAFEAKGYEVSASGAIDVASWTDLDIT